MVTQEYPSLNSSELNADQFDENEGLEEEREPEEFDQDEIEVPFDPNSIRIRTYQLPVSTLLDYIHHGDTDLQPSFQRRLGIWTHGKRSRLVESLLLRIPIPVFYAAADAEDAWSVVDGIQRLSTLDGYVKNEYKLRGLQYLQTFEGKYYSELPRNLQRRILDTQLHVNVLEHGTPEDVMFNIFLRINTGGTPLSGQEIRHAINPGPARGFLKEVAESQDFLEATTWSVNQRRMADRELVLRFMAFHINRPENYTTGHMDGFLNDTMHVLNTVPGDVHVELRRDFGKAMKASKQLFGDEAFRKPQRDGQRRGRINRALFESWGVNLASCTTDEISLVINRSDDVRSRFADLLLNPEFDAAISWATGSPNRVRTRFGGIQQLISEVLVC